MPRCGRLRRPRDALGDEADEASSASLLLDSELPSDIAEEDDDGDPEKLLGEWVALA